jgi:hypothetical protein
LFLGTLLLFLAFRDTPRARRRRDRPVHGRPLANRGRSRA